MADPDNSVYLRIDSEILGLRVNRGSASKRQRDASQSALELDSRTE
jgi:hypothetical protein